MKCEDKFLVRIPPRDGSAGLDASSRPCWSQLFLFSKNKFPPIPKIGGYLKKRCHKSYGLPATAICYLARWLLARSPPAHITSAFLNLPQHLHQRQRRAPFQGGQPYSLPHQTTDNLNFSTSTRPNNFFFYKQKSFLANEDAWDGAQTLARHLPGSGTKPRVCFQTFYIDITRRVGLHE